MCHDGARPHNGDHGEEVTTVSRTELDEMIDFLSGPLAGALLPPTCPGGPRTPVRDVTAISTAPALDRESFAVPGGAEGSRLPSGVAAR